MLRKGFFVNCAVLLILLLMYAWRMPMSNDLGQHFMLVDELTKYGGVRSSAPNLGPMAFYPTGSHWISAIIGRGLGSLLMGIIATSIIALFICYRLLIKLAGEESWITVAIFAILFVLAARTHSLIGWEVRVNFFYPQLVADVLLLGMLAWLARDPKPTAIVVVAAIAGWLGMWIQPLIALHLLAAALMVMSIQVIVTWRNEKKIPEQQIVAVVTLGVISGALALYHPSMKAIRVIAQHDGYLEYSYTHPTAVAVLCAAIGAANLWIHFRRKTAHVDMVLGAAVVASACLVFAQSFALHVMHLGSPYAVKKHMFIVFTLGLINAVRLIAVQFGPINREFRLQWLVAPVLAGLLSLLVLRSYDTRIEPIDGAIAYAKANAHNYAPGGVSPDLIQPPMINFMIAQAEFKRPMDMESLSWFTGVDPAKNATFVMVPSNMVSADCPSVDVSANYAIVKPVCVMREQINKLRGYGS